MKRRDFLKYSLYTSMMTGGAGSRGAHSAQAVPYMPYGRTLIHVMLLGGADLRFLFVPDPVASPEYSARFWQARQSIYQYNAANTALYPDYDATFSGLYTPATDTASGLSFGIHNNAAWLKTPFDLGNVAIVANVLGSSNRRHDHSQLIVHTGDVQASQYVYDHEGWGGRLAYGMTDANAVAVSNDISIFCNGIDSSNRNARDTRNFSFSAGDGDPVSDNSVMARALKAYYAQKQIEAETQPVNWPYRKFLQHEQALRGSGDAFNARLAEVTPNQPAALAALYTAASAPAGTPTGWRRTPSNQT